MDEQKAINAVETLLEGAEHTAETVIPEVAKAGRFVANNKIVLVGTAVVALSVGAFAGYQFAKKRLEPKYEALAQQEIREAREYYGRVHKKGEYATPEDAVAKLIPPSEAEAQDAMRRYQGNDPEMITGRTVEITEDKHGVHVKTVEERKEVQHRNIFVDGKAINDDDWDYDTELEQRTEDEPYIIHEDEFNENEPDFEDMVLTYYSGDDVLANDQDEVVDDVEGLVGSRNLRHFGKGASDPNMLHVRNHKRGLNIEISRVSGKYGTLVLNYDEDDDKPKRRRRSSDNE